MTSRRQILATAPALFAFALLVYAAGGQVFAIFILRQFFASLPEEFRVPIVLRDLGGHDYAEIAAILDIPAGTVRSRIARGRARLAELLGPGNQASAPDRPSTRP